MQLVRFLMFLLLFLTLSLLTGCIQSGPATVSGQITLDGKQLPETPQMVGTVMFYPVSGGAAACGSVRPGGNYSLSTGGTKGLEPGEYVVTVRVVDINPPPLGGYFDAPLNKPIVPRHYQDREKSTIKAQVFAGKNDIPLPLRSKKGDILAL